MWYTQYLGSCSIVEDVRTRVLNYKGHLYIPDYREVQKIEFAKLLSDIWLDNQL